MDDIEIADGIYLSFNGWHLKVRIVRDQREVVVYLGPAAIAELARFIAKVSLTATAVADEDASGGRQ